MNHRRQHLKLLASALLAAHWAPRTLAAPPKRALPDILIGGGRYIDPATPEVKKHVLSSINLADGSSRQIALGFLPHGIALQPGAPDRVVVFEKIGPGAAEIDLKRQQLVRMLPQNPQRLFYGHGAFSADGRKLYCTETSMETEQGFISIRAADTLAPIGDLPTYGTHPHDCTLLGDGKTLAITNGGGRLEGAEGGYSVTGVAGVPGGPNVTNVPCVTYVDTATGRLIERVTLSNTALNTGHLVIAPNGQLVIASAPRRGLPTTQPGGISLGKAAGESHSFDEPRAIVERMRGEALSIAVLPERNLFGVTHPGGDMVTFWQLDDGQFRGMVELSHARGITLDQQRARFLVTYGSDTRLAAIDPARLTLLESPFVGPTMISGSHLYNLTTLQRASKR